MIKTIIFDLGGVYFTDGSKSAVTTIAAKYHVPEKQVSEILCGKLGTLYRIGKLTAKEFWQQAKERWAIDVASSELGMTWLKQYQPINATIIQVQQLKKAGYELLFLSDNTKERVEYLENKYHFMKNFKDGVFSHKEGARKPDHKIYQAAMQKTSSLPEECIFIDDKEPLLEPAKKIGMKTVLFTDPQQLKEDLKDLGVI